MRKLDSIRRARGGIIVGGIALGVAAAVGLAACGSSDNCHFMPLATALIGQTTYAGYLANDSGPPLSPYPDVNGSGAPSGATLASPIGGLVANAAGTAAYIADTGNNRILGYTSFVPGTPTAAASFVIGQASLTTNGQSSGDAGCANFGLSSPNKVSISDTGTQLVVTDTGNNRVLIWNSLPTANTPPNVVIGQADCSGNNSNGANGGSAIAANTLSNPTAAMIGNGKLVVVDQNNNRVLIWNKVPTANGTPADVELGQDNSANLGFTTNVTGALNPTLQTIEFFEPTDLWTDGHSLFVSDTGNNRVLFWNQVPTVSNTTAISVIGQPSGFTTSNPGTSSQTLSSPVGIAAAANNFYIADAGNNRVLLFNGFPVNQQRGATAAGVFGQQDFTHHNFNDDDQNGVDGDQSDGQTNINATQNTLQTPSGAYADPNGNLWVSDRGNNRVLEYPVSSAVNGSQTDFCNGYNELYPNNF